jgi:aminomethyltransferase
MSESLRTSPLDAEHRALDARLTEFGGWDMPIQYRSVLEEHRACRNEAVVFDVSHLGSVRVTGAGALALLQWAFTNDLNRIGPGRAAAPACRVPWARAPA